MGLRGRAEEGFRPLWTLLQLPHLINPTADLGEECVRHEEVQLSPERLRGIRVDTPRDKRHGGIGRRIRGQVEPFGFMRHMLHED